MMNILVKRINKYENCTIGKLYLNGQFFCDTLEDKDRGLSSDMSLSDILSRKIYAQTAIPTGEYKIKLTYSNRFKKILPEILNVKGFQGVRIHSGNTENDSAGCILIGNRNKSVLTSSRDTMSELMLRLSSLPKDEEITLKIE